MPTCTIDAHQEDTDSGQIVSWPAATLTVNTGDYILANYGSASSYAPSDNAFSLTFGSPYAPGAWGTGTGTFTTGGHTYHYNGPYCNIAPADIDLEDPAFASVEILDFCDYTQDAYTNEWPNHSRSGVSATHGSHIKPNAAGRKHLHPHHPTRHHWHNMTFPITAYSGGNITITPTIAASGGGMSDEQGNSLKNFDGTNISFSAGTLSSVTVAAGNFLIYNGSNASVGGVASKSFGSTSFDPTTDGNVLVFLVSHYTPDTDAFSGTPWAQSNHQGHHQVHSVHVAKKSLAGRHLNNGTILATSRITFVSISAGTGGNWAASAQQTSTISISTDTYNALATGQWLMACGVDTGGGAPGSPGSDYAQPMGSFVLSGSSRPPSSFGPVLWDKVTGEQFGITVQSVSLSTTQITITWQGVAVTGAGSGNIYIWFQWLGITP